MTSSSEAARDFLDSAQYRTESILQYESVYGEDFVSPGGKAMAREMIECLDLAPGSKVLDVGCGLGGSAFVMAREFGLQVDGIDLSKNMLEIANRKLETYRLAGRASLEWGDCLELDREDAYDAIYSRDVFLHIHDKAQLFSLLRTALRPGGKLLFTDYCCGPNPWADDFADYVADRGYDLYTPDEYAVLIAAAGFSEVNGEDISDRFVSIMLGDLERIEALEIEPVLRDKLTQSWRQKLERSRNGDHRWGLFTARK